MLLCVSKKELEERVFCFFVVLYSYFLTFKRQRTLGVGAMRRAWPVVRLRVAGS